MKQNNIDKAQKLIKAHIQVIKDIELIDISKSNLQPIDITIGGFSMCVDTYGDDEYFDLLISIAKTLKTKQLKRIKKEAEEIGLEIED